MFINGDLLIRMAIFSLNPSYILHFLFPKVLLYKKFVLEMRKDLLGKNTKIGMEDIDIRGIVN